MRKTLLVAATSALIASAATATATTLITSTMIANGTIRSVDIRKGTIAIDRLAPSLQRKIRSSGVSTSSVPGSAGAPGQNDVSGAAGAKGDTGATGSAGTNGTNGTNGADGTNGTNGNDGTNGTDGATGQQGPRGFNADGSFTTKILASGDGDFTVAKVTGTSGNPPVTRDNATVAIANGVLKLSINSVGGGFARANHEYTANPEVQTLSALRYQYARLSGSGAGEPVAPAVKIDVVGATSCGAVVANSCENPPFAASPTETTLIYEPTYADASNPASATVDTLGAGNKWWSSRGIQGAGTRSTFVSIQSILAANPGMKIKRIYIDAGQNGAGGPWNDFEGSVDFLDIGFTGSIVNRYDFG